MVGLLLVYLIPTMLMWLHFQARRLGFSPHCFSYDFHLHLPPHLPPSVQRCSTRRKPWSACSIRSLANRWSDQYVNWRISPDLQTVVPVLTGSILTGYLILLSSLLTWSRLNIVQAVLGCTFTAHLSPKLSDALPLHQQ